MEEFRITPIDELQNVEMIPIMQQSTIHSDRMEVYFDKSPDLFRISRMHYTKSKHLGFYSNDELKGFGAIGFYDALVNGVHEKVFNLYNFYLVPEARGKKIPLTAARQLLEEAVSEKSNFGLALTLQGNKSTESYIGKQTESWMPPTRCLDQWVVHSLLFSKPIRNETKYLVRQARMEDVPEMVSLLQEEHRQRDFGCPFSIDEFSNELTKRGLDITDYYVAEDKMGFVKGVCLCWDCHEFRRTKVINYTKRMWLSLLEYQLMSGYWKMAPLPGAGDSFHELTITDYAVKNRDPEIMHALLVEIYGRNRQDGFHFMNWGSCASDPLLQASKGFWKTEIRSHLIFTSLDRARFNENRTLPYLDIAYL